MTVHYSDAQKIEALEIYRTLGSRVAGRQTGIPEGTIRHWASTAGVATEVNGTNAIGAEAARVRAEKLREELRLRILEQAADVLQRMNNAHTEKKVLADGTIVVVSYDLPTPSGVREYAVGFGILLDKYRLEMGEATDRTRSDVSVTGVSDEQIERDIARIAEVTPIRRTAKSG